METLMGNYSKIFLDIKGDRVFCFFKQVNNRHNKVCVFKFNNNQQHVGFLHIKNNKFVQQPICESSSKANFETTQVEEIYDQSRTVHVKFQLQRECKFGEQFFIVGDHLILGSWDLEKAVPLSWSDSHIWGVEMELPIDEPVQFKFILKDIEGDYVWQPGPDRVIKAWETEETITVCEDWENAEHQKIFDDNSLIFQNASSLEEDLLVFQNASSLEKDLVFLNDSALEEDPTVVQNESSLPEEPLVVENNISELLIVAENLTIPTEEVLSDVNRENGIGDDASRMDIPMVADNITPEPEQPVTFVADNIHISIKEPESNAKLEQPVTFVADNIEISIKEPESTDNERLGKMNATPMEVSADLTVIVPSKMENMMVAEDIVEPNGSATSSFNEISNIEVKNLITQDECPVLVPGLTPSSSSSLSSGPNDEIKAEEEKIAESQSIPLETTLGVDEEAMNENFREKQESGILQEVKAEISNRLEDKHDKHLYNNNLLPQGLEQRFSELFANNVLQTDFQWGRKTLKKLLTNLGWQKCD
ncbi:hypothetical protein ACFE04_012817 [Oxalis oulophora]